ncbi:MAG: hypothetical protein IKE51_05515 [Solobacterium sp.]|nr:hypothetical protein [Solobacterium sp.]
MITESTVLVFAMLFLSVTIFFCLLRAVLGPRTTDRLVAVNIISIKGVVLILLLGEYLHDNQFMDIALVYVLLSFLAVIALAKNMLARSAKVEKEDINGTI